MNSSGCGVAGTTGWENGSDGKVSETSSLQTRLQRREKRAPKLSVSRVARQSRDVSTVAENFRVFWKGVEAKARVGEKRGGCASYLALEAGLVGEALEANLVERIGRVAASRKGAWRSAGASTREIRRAIGAGKKSRQRSAGGGFCRHKTDATCARDRDDASAKRT